MTLEVVCFQAATVSVTGRRLRSLLIPWMTPTSDERRPMQFARGSVSEPRPWPLRAMHDSAAPGLPIGLAGINVAVSDTEAGLLLEATLPQTSHADDVLQLLNDGILGGASAEVVPLEVDRSGLPLTVKAARLAGAALVPTPAFTEATVQVYEAQEVGAAAARRRRIAAVL